MADAKTITATHPIHCPMCHSMLRVIHHQPESMFCADCGVSVTVPVYAWKKYQQPAPERLPVMMSNRPSTPNAR